MDSPPLYNVRKRLTSKPEWLLRLASFVSSYSYRANWFIRARLPGILPKLLFNTEQPVPDMNNLNKNDRNGTRGLSLATDEKAS